MGALRPTSFEERKDQPPVQALIRFITQTCGKQLEEVDTWWLMCKEANIGTFHVRFTDAAVKDGQIARMTDDSWEVL